DYNEGQTVPIVGEPNFGYHFTQWSGDVATVNDIYDPCTTVTMEGDYSITANFAVHQYTVTGSAGGNGSINPVGDNAVNYGGDLTLEAMPESCYEVNTWYLDGNDLETNSVSYTLTNVAGNHTIEVVFRQLQSVVPEVVGMTESAAEAALNAAGLEKGDVSYVYSTTAGGTVIEQDPNSGASVTCGSEVTLVVSIVGVYVWTNESPYSVLWCDPLNWDPNISVPGEGDTAIVNPPPWQGPVVQHFMSVSCIDGSRWTDGGDRWDIGDARFDKYGWDFDSNQVMQLLDGDMSIGSWTIGDTGDGTSMIDIGTQAGGTWGEPNIHLGHLEGFDEGAVLFTVAGNSKLEIDDYVHIIEDEDAEVTFDIRGNAQVTANSGWRFCDDGDLNFYLSDNASVDIDGTFRMGDESDAYINMLVSGGSLSTTYSLGVGDDGAGHIDISGGTIEVGEDWYMSCRRGADIDVNMSGGGVSVSGKVLLCEAGEEGGILPGACELDMTGGTIEAQSIWMAREAGGTAIINMTGGHITVDNEFYVPKSNYGTAEIYLHGGVIECGEFLHGNPGHADYRLDICGDGVMVIDGNVAEEIWEDYFTGYITVCGNHTGCGAQYDLQVDYNNVNVGRTTIWVERDPYQPYDPDPGCCTDPNSEPAPQQLCLSWTPGEAPCPPPLTFYVYLSTDINKMQIGDLSAKIAETENNSVCVEDLCLGATYYWRLDAVCECYTAHGDVWCFDVVDCVTVDDMESYDNDDPNNYIWDTWLDGAGNVHGQGGNATGSAVFSASNPDLEQSNKVMEYQYNSTGWEREYAYSEANRPLDPPENWTDNCEKVLSLWFYGDANNMTESMWVLLSDDSNEAISEYGVMGDDPADIKKEEWIDWNIDLQDFADGGVDLSNITSISIGFGPRGRDGEHPSDPVGAVFFDNIAVCTTICVPKYAPDGDINDDCVVDWEDLKLLAEDWLTDLCKP
ncbi:MAG: InlB B-repeat-containing protein, partial [Planctomycetota bacterium]